MDARIADVKQNLSQMDYNLSHTSVSFSGCEEAMASDALIHNVELIAKILPL